MEMEVKYPSYWTIEQVITAIYAEYIRPAGEYYVHNAECWAVIVEY